MCHFGLQYIMRVLRLGALIVLGILTVVTSKEPEYTQDIVLYKSEQFNLRMELLTGCWIYAKEHLDLHPELIESEFSPITLEDLEVSLVRKCLKNIKRVDSVSKMRALVDPGSVKNQKMYLDIVKQFTKQDINQSPSQFQQYLKPFLKKYREDMVDIQKKGFKEEIEKRRRRKLFGIIDIGNTSPTLVMGGITLVLVALVTFVKYRRRVKEADAKKEIRKQK